MSTDNVSRLIAHRALLTVAILGWMASGCARAPIFNRLGAVSDPRDVEQLCEAVMRDRVDVSTSRGVVEATIHPAHNESLSFRYAIAYKAPSDLRIDVLPLQGAYTLALFTARADGATLIDANEKTFATSARADQLLERLLGFRGFSPEVVAALLQGEIPKVPCKTVSLFNHEGRLSLLNQSTHVVWIVDGLSSRLKEVVILDQDNETMQIVAAIESAPTRRPRITVRMSQPRATASLDIVKVSHDSKIPDALFAVAIPPGYREVE